MAQVTAPLLKTCLKPPLDSLGSTIVPTTVCSAPTARASFLCSSTYCGHLMWYHFPLIFCLLWPCWLPWCSPHFFSTWYLLHSADRHQVSSVLTASYSPQWGTRKILKSYLKMWIKMNECWFFLDNDLLSLNNCVPFTRTVCFDSKISCKKSFFCTQRLIEAKPIAFECGLWRSISLVRPSEWTPPSVNESVQIQKSCEWNNWMRATEQAMKAWKSHEQQLTKLMKTCS